jgi:hypothetical protein
MTFERSGFQDREEEEAYTAGGLNDRLSGTSKPGGGEPIFAPLPPRLRRLGDYLTLRSWANISSVVEMILEFA